MTPEQIEQLAKEIVDGLSGVANMIGLLDPQLIPLIIIGQAVSKIAPEIAKAVARWIEGNPPTPEELDEFKKKLAALSDPDAP